jgi:hypothetical protein
MLAETNTTEVSPGERGEPFLQLAIGMSFHLRFDTICTMWLILLLLYKVELADYYYYYYSSTPQLLKPLK